NQMSGRGGGQGGRRRGGNNSGSGNSSGGRGGGRRGGGGGGRGGGAVASTHGIQMAAQAGPVLATSHAEVVASMTAAAAAAAAAEDAQQNDGDGEACHICAEPVTWYAVGECNHRVCHICSLRLRALYKSKACTFCKTDLDKVVFTGSSDLAFESFTLRGMKKDAKLAVFFETDQIYDETMVLLRFNCPDPECPVACPGGWSELRNHVKAAHELLLCELCIRHKKVFTHEHTLFTSEALRIHSRDGDPSDPSFKGHPECGFCRNRFYSYDELYEHCREKHEQCFLCNQQGIRNQYFQDYQRLEEHFNKDHFPCRNPECLEKKFIVFASDIDLEGHKVRQTRSAVGALAVHLLSCSRLSDCS
ncbi:hypothetical protein BC831DRAFT_398260, partial [Entophlyctis helioformis]